MLHVVSAENQSLGVVLGYLVHSISIQQTLVYDVVEYVVLLFGGRDGKR